MSAADYTTQRVELADETGEIAADQQTAADILLQFVDIDGKGTPHPNIAELIEDDESPGEDGEWGELSKIGQTVLREYKIDVNSRKDWKEKMESAMEAALQVSEKKTFPWPDASNVKYPLLTVAAIQFAARAYPAIVAGSMVTRCKVVGDDSGKPAMDDEGPIIDPESQQPVWEVQPGAKRRRGDRVSRHMSWQLIEEMPEWEPDTDRLLHVLPITGIVFRKTRFDNVEGRNRSDMVLAEDLVINYHAKSMEDAPRITHIIRLYPHEITERVRGGVFLDQDLGLAKDAGDDPDKEHKFLEQHRLMDLDDDGYPEPYIVTIHEDTAKVMRIVARYDGDSVSVNDAGEVKQIIPQRHFTKFGFIPNPESAIYDLGFGTLLHPINESVNTILNQVIDAGTIQVAGGGFISKGLRIKGGPLRFAAGEYKRVESMGAKIADSIYTMKHPGPDAVLISLLGLLIEAGKDISSVQDIMTGDQGHENVTATTTLAMVEQGMKTFTSIFKRVHRSLKAEYKLIYDLNRRYLPDESYFTVLDNTEAIAKADYEDESYDIVPVSDPTVVTDMQKMSRAQFLMGFMGDPFFDGMDIRKRVLEAASIDDIETLLTGPPPPPPDTDKIKTIGELALKKDLQPSEIAKNLAAAIKSLADAGSAEGSPELWALRQQLEEIMDEFSRGAGLSGMVGQPDGQMVPQIPEGPPPGPTGPMG